MATAKKATKAAKTPARKAVKSPRASAKAALTKAEKPSAALKPIKESFKKTSLINHLATVAGQEPKAVRR